MNLIVFVETPPRLIPRSPSISRLLADKPNCFVVPNTQSKGLVHKPPFRHPNFIGICAWFSAVGLWSFAYRI